MQTFFALLIALILIGGGAYWYTQRTAAPMDTSVDVTIPANTNTNPTPAPTVPSSTTTDTGAAGTVKEITVTNNGMSFTQKTLSVKRGDTVKVTFKNTGGTHDWVIDEFPGARTKVLQAGQEETVTFVADKAGSFEYYCSVGQHRANGMWGTLTVTP